MKSEESPFLRNPMDDDDWLDAVKAVRRGLQFVGRAIALSHAETIRRGIETLDPTMERYCRATCPSCEDLCCSGHAVFYNQADLLYLASSGLDIPDGQTRSHSSLPCRYLTGKGCRLPRVRRPYVCVWFLCEPQIDLFERETARFQRDFIKTVQDIRAGRLMIEYLYESSAR